MVAIFDFVLLGILAFFSFQANGAATGDDWANLNKTLNNRLRKITPLALPCFSQLDGSSILPQPEACSTVQSRYTDDAYRVDQLSAYVFTQSESCAPAADQQCLLDPTNPLNAAAFTNTSCNQGGLPAYSIQIENPEDVKAAFEFASRTKTAISIKNSGHDYNGRSSGPGSLSLWTRKLQTMKYDKAFVPESCPHTKATPAITVGAGVNFAEVYAFANSQGVTYLGGSGPTVGASGGWVMTAGHGVLSRAYGLGVHRVLQFEVVTPDGIRRIANSCQNQDLFWALRGGGGSTFGVVLSTTSRVEPKLNLAVAFISLPPTSPSAVQSEWLNLLVNSTLRWADEGWGGFQGPGISLVVTPLLSLAQAESSMANLASFAKAQGGSAVIETVPDFQTLYTKYFVPTTQPGGDNAFSHTWIIPERIYKSKEGRKQLREHMDWMSSVGLSPGFLVTTPYLYSGNGNPNPKVKPWAYGPPDSTSTTQAWQKGAALLTTAASWAYNASVDQKKDVARLLVEASNRAKTLAPDGGAYANEAHPWTQDWQSAFWGSNYQKLSAAKKKWDPNALLGCWHCVGSENSAVAEVVGGKCLGNLI